MKANESIENLAAQIRASNVLGRSEALKKLFDFLIERSADAIAPKEVEVALSIFGPGANFDASQDASVRVYVHRLRQKLDEYYRGPGRAEVERLSIPKGSGYRIVIEPNIPLSETGAQAAEVEAQVPPRPFFGRWGIAGVLALLVAANIAGWIFFSTQRPADEYAAVREQTPWSALLHDARPITLVVGDYYIFGEINADGKGDRLVREYTINSPGDLDTYLMQHPEMLSRYMDLGLYYLPVSAASALRSIMPILTPIAKDRDRVRVVQASDLTPDMIKRTNIVYVGYLSGLGLLREPVFAGSRFSVGDTYDELIDNDSKQHYFSQEGGPGPGNRKLRDFGYVSTFTGPSGNHFIIIAGTRDIALMQTAEAAADAQTLDVMTKKAAGASAFEALYQVEGMRRINMAGQLLLVSPLKTEKIWSSQPSAIRFPDG